MRPLALWRRYLGAAAPGGSAPPDLPRAVARLQLQAVRRMAAPWVGAYRTAFKGCGVELAGVREYVPGDDSRTVDWRVTARTGRLTVRRYVEERDRHVLFIVDVGPATVAGSGDRSLRELAAEVVALLGSAALASGDRVGLLAWSDRRELLEPPQRRAATLLRTVGRLLALRPTGTASDLAGALEDARRILRHPGVVTVISPLLDPRVPPLLTAMAARHDLLLVRLADPLAGRGTARGRAPAVASLGRGGPARPAWSLTATPPPDLPAAVTGARTLTVTPLTALAPALGRALLGRGGGGVVSVAGVLLAASVTVPLGGVFTAVVPPPAPDLSAGQVVGELLVAGPPRRRPDGRFAVELRPLALGRLAVPLAGGVEPDEVVVAPTLPPDAAAAPPLAVGLAPSPLWLLGLLVPAATFALLRSLRRRPAPADPVADLRRTLLPLTEAEAWRRPAAPDQAAAAIRTFLSASLASPCRAMTTRELGRSLGGRLALPLALPFLAALELCDATRYAGATPDRETVAASLQEVVGAAAELATSPREAP